MKKALLYIIMIVNLFSLSAFAQNGEPGREEVLTKGDAVMLLSATDFVRKKIADLLSWTIGYDISKLSRVQLTPSINYVKAIPKKVPPDGRTVFEIVASVDDPGGLGNIAGVRADLSSIGRLPNMMLVDNGLFGDAKSGDGIYTLQASIATEITDGPKEVPVAVANKKGWLALAKTTVDIKKDPVITEAAFVPERVRADGKETVVLVVKIENPGRIEDVKEVTADLRALGYSQLLLLRNDGAYGDLKAADDVFSLQFSVPEFVKAGDYPIRIGVSNLADGYAFGDVIMKVYK